MGYEFANVNSFAELHNLTLFAWYLSTSCSCLAFGEYHWWQWKSVNTYTVNNKRISARMNRCAACECGAVWGPYPQIAPARANHFTELVPLQAHRPRTLNRFPLACLWGSIGMGMLTSHPTFRIDVYFTIVTPSKGYSISFSLSVIRKVSLHSLNWPRARIHSTEPVFCSHPVHSNCGAKWFLH